MKIFGSKGLRNTPGKKIMPNKDWDRQPFN